MRPRGRPRVRRASCSSSTTCRWSGAAAARRFFAGFARCRTTASLEHPELAAAAAAAAVLDGGSAIEQRRFVRLADRARVSKARTAPTRTSRLGSWSVRALRSTVASAEAVRDGRRAVELARASSDEILTGALCAYARALYFAGDLHEASAAASQVLEHPDIARRAPSLVLARSTLALVAVERGRLDPARRHAERGEGRRRPDREQP